MRTRQHRVIAGATAIALVVVGAAGTFASDKSGDGKTILRLATIENELDTSGVMYAPVTFVTQLEELSGGRLEVQLITEFASGSDRAEAELIEAIARGDVDGGWPSVRAFADAGIPGLNAIEAPMTITSYAAERDLVSGRANEVAMGLLEGTGIQGLGLAVGPLRRPFSAGAPILTLDDWQGTPFRSFDSPVQTATYEALGATPVIAAGGWIDLLKDGRLRGTEFDIIQAEHNGIAGDVPFATSNVVLWPKVWVLSMNQAVFEGLTAEEQGWVRDAAVAAVQASTRGTYPETRTAKALCSEGMRFFDVSPDQLRAMRAAVEPVIAGLAADPASAELLAEVEAAGARHPSIQVPDVPPSCRTFADAPRATELPTTTAALPDGVYRAEIQRSDVDNAGVDPNPGWTGVWTYTISDGTFSLTCDFIDDPRNDCGHSEHDGGMVEAGYVRGADDQVVFVNDAQIKHDRMGCELPASFSQPGHCSEDHPYGARWSLEDQTLTFWDAWPGANQLTIVPWVRIG